MLDSKAPIQAAYNEIRAYFSRPGAILAKEDIGGGTACLYRTSEGHACAVGCRISDAWIEAHGGVEAVNNCGGIQSLVNEYPDAKWIVGNVGAPLFRFHARAQRAHDSIAKSPKDFVKLLDIIAKENGLDVPVA